MDEYSNQTVFSDKQEKRKLIVTGQRINATDYCFEIIVMVDSRQF